MIDPIEQNPNHSLSGAQPGGMHQTPKTEELIAQMITEAGANTSEANLLEDWNELLTDDQTAGTTTQKPHQPHLKKAEENAMTAYLNNPVNTANPLTTNITPGVDNTAAADNSNTGSINGSTLV
jgi:hypothetical protein